MENIVKKIDGLGRIAIPKDIRRAMRLVDGDELEIIVTDQGILLRRYLPNFSDKLHNLQMTIQDYLQTENLPNDDEIADDFQKLIEKIQKYEK